MSGEARRYEYPTGNLETMVRLQAGEPFLAVMDDVKAKWTPGNEHLWDEYDIESLVDTDDRRQYAVNQLLFSRISVYRALKAKGIDALGKDPFQFLEHVPGLVGELRARFPQVLGEGFGRAG